MSCNFFEIYIRGEVIRRVCKSCESVPIGLYMGSGTDISTAEMTWKQYKSFKDAVDDGWQSMSIKNDTWRFCPRCTSDVKRHYIIGNIFIDHFLHGEETNNKGGIDEQEKNLPTSK